MSKKTNGKQEIVRLTSLDSYDDTQCIDYLVEEDLPSQFAGNRNLAVTRMNTDTENYKVT